MAGKARAKTRLEGGLRLDPFGPGEDQAAKAAEMARFRKRVLQLVARIPPGRVATYGQISALAGHPRRARHVGQALAGPHDPGLPWHRVINAQGRVSPRGGEATRRGPPPERRQQRLLEAEGVTFSRGRIDLDTYRWRPEEDGGAVLRGMRPVSRRGPARHKTNT